MKKILIIDDHAERRHRIRAALESEAFQFHEAGAGNAGWQLARALRPDIVLLDALLPGPLGGLDVCRRLKADPQTRHAQIILVSSAPWGAGDQVAGLAAGADQYLFRPFSVARLMEVVHSVHATPAVAAVFHAAWG